jgi:hypothetical protein
MTFREFYTKKTAKCILLRGVSGYAVCLLAIVALFWVFDRDYLARIGVVRVLGMAAVAPVALTLFQF